MSIIYEFPTTPLLKAMGLTCFVSALCLIFRFKGRKLSKLNSSEYLSNFCCFWFFLVLIVSFYFSCTNQFQDCSSKKPKEIMKEGQSHLFSIYLSKYLVYSVMLTKVLIQKIPLNNGSLNNGYFPFRKEF